MFRNGWQAYGDQCAWCTRPAAHWHEVEGVTLRICFECGCCGHPDWFRSVRLPEIERERREREDAVYEGVRR